jgi:hypothetical protein
MRVRVLRGRGSLRAGAVGLLLAALLAGCSGGQADPPSESPSPSDEASSIADSVNRSRTFLAKVRAQGTGAAAFTWEGEQEILLTRVGNKDIDVNLLSAGFKLPEIVTNDRSLRFRWAFDLLNAYGDEPGTFTIDGAPEGGQGLRSSAFLIFMKVKDPSKDEVFDMKDVEFLKEFNQMKQACTVEVGEGEKTGKLVCPELATTEGESAGITVVWEQIGPDKPND